MNWLLVSIFILQLTALFFISRYTITVLFQTLRIILKHDSAVFGFIAFIFLPGTIIHEMSHFLMAIILMLKVREVHIFPEWDKNYIKLGRVIYEKKDFLRGILVGIAPIIVGLLLFWWFSAIQAIQITNIPLKVLIFYFIFVISSTMFSSRQDLIDIVYVIPLLIITGIVLYIFPVDFSFITSQQVIIEALQNFMYDVNIYLIISIIIHVILISALRLVLTIIKQ